MTICLMNLKTLVKEVILVGILELLLDKDGKFDPEDASLDDYVLPHIQELFPESAQNKLSSYRNYTDEQMEIN